MDPDRGRVIPLVLGRWDMNEGTGISVHDSAGFTKVVAATLKRPALPAP